MKTLTKTAARFEVKALDEKKRTFKGLASTWDEDLGGDVIHQGAFARTLDHWRAGGKVLPLIDQHNYGSVRSVVGKMLSATETDAGLEAEFEIIEGPDGDEVMRRVKGGYIDSLSIGYEAVKWEMEKPDGAESWESVRHLKEIKLYEVSVVIWPMNPGAVIDADSLKSLLREGRLSNDEKKQLRALLEASGTDSPDEGTPAPDAPKGLAPDDPKRLALEAELRAITLRSLGTAA
jgi:HK97 family phage prohead protease